MRLVTGGENNWAVFWGSQWPGQAGGGRGTPVARAVGKFSHPENHQTPAAHAPNLTHVPPSAPASPLKDAAIFPQVGANDPLRLTTRRETTHPTWRQGAKSATPGAGPGRFGRTCFVDAPMSMAD
ncbi:hypothetical protein Bbelb_067030 [Branchiostoma belcheri]|nr:hypothetical protein Bbelb_067030 [Branchiostoma belcheri]